MGLYQKMVALSEQPKGLLKKAEKFHSVPDQVEQEPVDSAPVSFFKQLARDYDLIRYMMLTSEDTRYRCSFSYNLDPDSAFQSDSTRDFWDGTFTTECKNWVSVTGEELLPYLQIFSSKDRETIHSLLVRRVCEPTYHLDYILLLPEESEKSMYTPDQLKRCINRLNEYLIS